MLCRTSAQTQQTTESLWQRSTLLTETSIHTLTELRSGKLRTSPSVGCPKRPQARHLIKLR